MIYLVGRGRSGREGRTTLHYTVCRPTFQSWQENTYTDKTIVQKAAKGGSVALPRNTLTIFLLWYRTQISVSVCIFKLQGSGQPEEKQCVETYKLMADLRIYTLGFTEHCKTLL